MRAVEGRIPFRGHETWYRDLGPEDGVALLCLHGGPGSTHHYFTPLEALAEDGRRVVMYDQLGCGSSDRPDDPELWTVELFRSEVQAVRDALGLSRIHLLGTSWGAMLAQEYVLAKPAGLVSLTLNSPPTSAETWMEEAGRLKDELPEETRRALDELPPDHPDHVAAEDEFWRRHVCILDPWPDFVDAGSGRQEPGDLPDALGRQRVERERTASRAGTSVTASPRSTYPRSSPPDATTSARRSWRRTRPG